MRDIFKAALLAGMISPAALGQVQFTIDGGTPQAVPTTGIISVGTIQQQTTVHIFDVTGGDESVGAIDIEGTSRGAALRVQVAANSVADAFALDPTVPITAGLRRVAHPNTSPAACHRQAALNLAVRTTSGSPAPTGFTHSPHAHDTPLRTWCQVPPQDPHRSASTGRGAPQYVQVVGDTDGAGSDSGTVFDSFAGALGNCPVFRGLIQTATSIIPGTAMNGRPTSDPNHPKSPNAGPASNSPNPTTKNGIRKSVTPIRTTHTIAAGADSTAGLVCRPVMLTLPKAASMHRTRTVPRTLHRSLGEGADAS